MVTISKIVENYIKEHPFIQEALARGIINYAAISEQIKPQVEINLDKKVKDSAIMMAFRRHKEKLNTKYENNIDFGDGADVFLKSNLFEVTFKKSYKINKMIKELYDSIKGENDFFTLTEGLTQITIISNERNKKIILDSLKGEKIVEIIDGLACIGTSLPKRATYEIGYFYVITRAFSWEQIPIIEIVSTLNELNFIIREKDVPRAFTVLKDVIK